jgi:hypothetical protein
VKTSNTTTGLIAALLLASPLASAESQYPAANFEPVIITRDADLIAKHGQAAKDREQAEQAKLAKRNQAATASASPESSEVAQPSGDAGAENSGNGAAAQKESSMENFPIALVVFALAGFVFWSTKRPGGKTQEIRYESAAAATGGAAGNTGVAKYLKELELAARKAAGTGVAKYLKGLEASSAKPANVPSDNKAATGVEKYLSSQGR